MLSYTSKSPRHRREHQLLLLTASSIWRFQIARIKLTLLYLMSLFDNYIIGMFVFILVGKNRKKAGFVQEVLP
ncbi:hypothetical protein DWW55_08415 [Paraprevotella clara]|nr:hypothetical protein DWW55_08415 [Paraprevotella clara]